MRLPSGMQQENGVVRVRCKAHHPVKEFYQKSM
jgi:hypothetical protein